MRRALLLMPLAAAAVASAQMPEACPWLNAGTAAKALGTEVEVTAATTSPWKGTCRFVAATGSVEISVGSQAADVCGAGGEALRGIGNVAVRCSRRDAAGRAVETVAGRVRDAWFVVDLAVASAERRGAQHEAAERAAIEFLAEQVAGNLY